MPDLIDLVKDQRKQEAAEDRASRDARREAAAKKMEEGFRYVFDDDPDRIEPYGREGAVAHKDGLRFVFSYGGASSSVGGLHVVCTCKSCGEEFVSYESCGALKNHYGKGMEGTPASRLEYAIKELAKLHGRNYQPNGYGHDHTCFEGSVGAVVTAVQRAARDTKRSTFEILRIAGEAL